MIGRAPLLILALLLTASASQAQSGGVRDDALGLSIGYSWVSPQQWGIIQNRHVTMVSARIETQLVRGARATLVHTFELPVTIVARKSSRVTNACWPREPSICMRDTSSSAEAGFGVLPLGLKLYMGPHGTSRLFVNAAGGISAFSGNVPTVDARRFNFMAEAGIGVELPAPGRRRVIFGYKYVHVSNADTAPSNPGLDANLVYVGLTYRATAK
jgi:hypothetical protein